MNVNEVADRLVDIVSEYEGLGAHEAELMKADFVRLLVSLTPNQPNTNLAYWEAECRKKQ